MTSSAPHHSEPAAPLPVAGPDSGLGLTEAGRFSVLDAGQLDVLLTYGTEQVVVAGEVLFAEGDKGVDLIVVLEGEVQIVVNAGLPTESVIVTYGPGQFVGEIALLTGQRAPVAAVACTQGQVLHTHVTALLGDDRLEGVELIESATGHTSLLAVGALFVFIGATPCTQWLDGQFAVDDHGFLLTGPVISPTQREPTRPTPLFLETSRAGVFAVGDVRSGSIKRVAVAAGEGSMAVRLVFERLQATDSAVAQLSSATR